MTACKPYVPIPTTSTVLIQMPYSQTNWEMASEKANFDARTGGSALPSHGTHRCLVSHQMILMNTLEATGEGADLKKGVDCFEVGRGEVGQLAAAVFSHFHGSP